MILYIYIYINVSIHPKQVDKNIPAVCNKYTLITPTSARYLTNCLS